MSLFDQVKLLYDSELYHDLKMLGSIVLSICDHNPDIMTMSMRYQTLVHCGDAHYQLAEYKKAESLYRKALQMKKVMNKAKGKTQPLVQDMTSDVDLKYKLYQCYYHLKEYRDAITMLETISSKQRSSKIHMALARLYQQSGMDRAAIMGYKEVLRECPLALEAALGLLSLGIKGAEVASLMMHGLPTMSNLDWLSSWIKGHYHIASREYSNAVTTLKILDSKSLLRDSAYVLCSLGEAHSLNGEYNSAVAALQKAHALDPYILKNMDILAYRLYKDKKVSQLYNLAKQLMSITDMAPQPWVAMAYYSMTTRKGMTRAIYFAHKALNIEQTYLEALLVKAMALQELKKLEEATMHYREALRLAPHRYEAHKGLVECYLANNRSREAITWAGHAYKQLGANARSLTLYSSVLAKEPLTILKAKTYLEKALKLDPTHLEAVYMMADILYQQQQFDRGIELLKRQLQQQSTCKLHQLLGDFLARTNEHQEALDQYNIALSLDPSNLRAREGMERVEKHGDMGLEGAYDMEDIEGSENEGELEESDIESAWSDIDLS